MAHTRKRHILAAFKKILSFSPITGVFGHRQVGKSTFLSSQTEDYRTLDDLDQLDLASSSPKKFIASLLQTPMIIDECQLEPKLFPTLKEWVRIHKRPGQYVLSGSVRFTSKKNIRESLAGRIGIVEMLPFSVSEILEKPLSDIVPTLLRHKIFSDESLRILNSRDTLNRYQKSFESYLDSGGLPGLCFIRDKAQRARSLSDLHDLILSRDLKFLIDSKLPLETIKKLLVYVAQNAFQIYNASEVKRRLGLAPQTQKNLLNALESIFLIRRIQTPLRKKELWLLEDQLEENFYAKGLLEKKFSLEGAVYRNIRTSFAYGAEPQIQYEHFLTRDHARVPIVVIGEHQTLGIIVCLGAEPTLSEQRSATSFLSHYINSKILFLSYESRSPKIINQKVMMASIAAVL